MNKRSVFAPKATVPVKNQLLNSLDLATALGLAGPWLIYGIKKANRQLAAQGSEPLIFSGRYSTPAKVSAWLDAHPEFVAKRVLAPQAAKTPEPRDTPGHPPA